jgi:hypothetical protein
MIISGYGVFKELEDIKRHFYSDNFDISCDSNSLSSRYVFEQRHKKNVGLFNRLANKFNSKKDIDNWFISIFVYHPLIEQKSDIGKISISKVQHDDEINQACYKKLNFHQETITQGFNRDISFLKEEGLNVQNVFSGSDVFFYLKNKNIRLETVIAFDKIEPFLSDIFLSLTAIEQKVYSYLFYKIKKYSKVVDISEGELGLLSKKMVDIL